jgi:hypothetical protein
MTFVEAVALRQQIHTSLGWPDDLLAVEQNWSGKDGGEAKLGTGYRVAMALPFGDADMRIGRVRSLDQARDFLKIAKKWDLRVAGWGEGERSVHPPGQASL